MLAGQKITVAMTKYAFALFFIIAFILMYHIYCGLSNYCRTECM